MVQQIITELLGAAIEKDKVADITKACWRTMPTMIRTPLKIGAFNANGIERQAYEIRKQLQALK
jgi:hypothetical protein